MDYYRLHELPDTYKKCKAYTDKFEGWLIDIAKQRGLEIAAEAECSAKEAAKKRSKKGVTEKSYKILIHHLMPLAEAVAGSGKPVEDTSGFADLKDAIRTRKEVTAYYRYRDMDDEGHAHVLGILSDISAVLKNWIVPVLHYTATEHDVEDASMHLNSHGSSATAMYDVCDLFTDIEESSEEPLPYQKKPASNVNEPYKRLNSFQVASLTKEELELEQQFQVLCFLYDFNQIVLRVRQVWTDWKYKKIGTMEAALVSDIAQGYIRQKVMALVEDLEDNYESCKLVAIVKELYRSYQQQAQNPINLEMEELEASDENSAKLFCIHGIVYMQIYISWRKEKSKEARKDIEKKFPPIAFLSNFDAIRFKRLRTPILDNFTESLCCPSTRSELWLPFGLQMLLAIQDVLGDDSVYIFKDITEHGMRTADLVKEHMDYEDLMWDAGTKPDYMSAGQSKFSNVFLPTLQMLLEWLKQLTEEDEAGKDKDSKFNNSDLVTMHPILGGLVMYHFQKFYQNVSIGKVNWFIVCLVHLYNACRQVGGLCLDWPDLDFIIKMHGPTRIFVGDAPVDPNVYKTRLTLAMCASSRLLAKDHRGQWNRAPREIRAKRGLQEFLPVQNVIKEYYGTFTDETRWIRLHNLFAYLKKGLDAEVKTKNQDTLAEDTSTMTQLHVDFASILDKLSPRQKNGKKRRKRSRVKQPDLLAEEGIHAKLLANVSSQLRDQEVHANFDYLSFYRRAYAFFSEVRDTVLWKDPIKVEDLTVELEEPSNFHLLHRLFKDIQIRDKDKKIKAEGRGVSRNVIALNKLKSIARIMTTLIDEQGDAELKNAKSRMRQYRNEEISSTHPELVDLNSGLEREGQSDPFACFHRFTYPSNRFKSRKRILVRGLLHYYHQVVYRTKLDPQYHSVGIRKHRISFKCYGQCPFGHYFLDSGFKDRKLTNTRLVTSSDNEDDNDGWETDTGSSDPE